MSHNMSHEGASRRKINNTPDLVSHTEDEEAEEGEMKKSMERLAANARSKYMDAMRFLDTQNDSTDGKEEEEEDTCGLGRLYNVQKFHREKRIPSRPITIHAELVILDSLICPKCKS